MNKKKIIYWISTGWLALGMLSTGIVQLIRLDEEVVNFASLGYPAYLMTIIGSWKVLGVLAVMAPGLVTLKEWAYAGFFFTMTGAIISHLVAESPISMLFGPVLLLTLVAISWNSRPVERKCQPSTEHRERHESQS